MDLNALLLEEFDQEIAKTRTILQRIPAAKKTFCRMLGQCLSIGERPT